ncbi:MAG: helix-turn-helix transcriptional regulator [Oscillibacter sp.]|nr:helix-turn-helix transcriptional regulator [Oscillibacter sp.]
MREHRLRGRGVPPTEEDPYNVERCDLICTHEEIIERVRAELPDEDTLYDLTELFRIFGDSTRVRILYLLFASEMCVCDMAALLGLTQSAVSHQLRALKNVRLVKARREGKTVFYSLADDHVKTIINQGLEHVREWAPPGSRF